MSNVDHSETAISSLGVGLFKTGYPVGGNFKNAKYLKNPYFLPKYFCTPIFSEKMLSDPHSYDTNFNKNIYSKSFFSETKFGSHNRSSDRLPRCKKEEPLVVGRSLVEAGYDAMRSRLRQSGR